MTMAAASAGAMVVPNQNVDQAVHGQQNPADDEPVIEPAYLPD